MSNHSRHSRHSRHLFFSIGSRTALESFVRAALETPVVLMRTRLPEFCRNVTALNRIQQHSPQLFFNLGLGIRVSGDDLPRGNSAAPPCGAAAKCILKRRGRRDAEKKNLRALRAFLRLALGGFCPPRSPVSASTSSAASDVRRGMFLLFVRRSISWKRTGDGRERRGDLR